MVWDFSTEPGFDSKLVWMREFIDAEVLPLEALAPRDEATFRRIVGPLQEIVKSQGLWAAHLPPELGGQGFGQVKLALMHEILGRSSYAPSVFGNQAPDSGNAELIALAGTESQKERWLWPLLDGRLRSGFSMTEPEVAGSDPTVLRSVARRDGDGWVLDGHKWYTSSGSAADLLVVMAVTNPEAPGHLASSMFVVDSKTPGIRIARDIPTMETPDVIGSGFRAGGYGHAEIYYESVRLTRENLLGEEGQGFVLAQKRLGPGRLHHCMRWLGQGQRAFDMLCERSLSRTAHGSPLADKGMVQSWIADSAAELLAARLMTLYAAWRLDNGGSEVARNEISMIKYYGAQVLYNVIDRSLQAHGGLGYSTDMPLEAMYRYARAARIYDGPDEVHKIVVARRMLRDYRASEVPTEHVPTRRAAAIEKFADVLERASEAW
jgi:acyl-CoA dehydrogenase